MKNPFCPNLKDLSLSIAVFGLIIQFFNSLRHCQKLYENPGAPTLKYSLWRLSKMCTDLSISHFLHVGSTKSYPNDKKLASVFALS